MKFRNLLILLLLSTLLCSVAFGARNVPYVDDQAQVLTDLEEQQLEARLRGISDKHDMDVVLVTTTRHSNGTIEASAENYLAYGGYRGDGIILMLYFSDQGNEYYMYAQDRCWDLFEDRGFAAIEDACVPLLKSGDYAGACEAYADVCDGVMSGTIKGGKAPLTPLHVILCIVVGAVLSFLIPMAYLKGQLKTVRYQPAAGSYIRRDSMKLRVQKDRFLYQSVTRVAKPKNNSSGGGSRSGGHRGGGRGGSF